jgi:thiamine-phosphate pyrophosphorylase
MKIDKNSLQLYAVTDRSWLRGETLYTQVEKALKGGVTFLQLREKNLDKEAFIKEALKIQELSKAYNVPLVINDNVEVARLTNADGVHIGQKDEEIAKARAVLGEDKIIGVTARTVQQAIIAEKSGADYLGVGAVFGSSTKTDAVPLDFEALQEICNSVTIPVVAIGGINSENIHRLRGANIAGVAVISGIFGAENIQQETALLKKQVLEILR